MENKKLKVAISHGDINGIGYEILLKTFADATILELFTPVIFGSAKVAAYYRKTLELELESWNHVSSAAEAVEGKVNLVNCVPEDAKVEMGECSPMAGTYAAQALSYALQAVKKGEADVLVTMPINKAAMPQDVFPYKGHTEFLQAEAGLEDSDALMILTQDSIRTALVTMHEPLVRVPSLISKELIMDKLRAFDRSLRTDFGIVRPRIAVMALNPHAGDNGLIGTEEIETIRPAVQEAEEQGLLAFGPYAADGFWGSDLVSHFDGVLSMYHDQGLAPFKALCMERGVNVTAGLSVVRTSPDHGTGFDIVGKGEASPDSFRAAVFQAIDIYRSRATWRHATRNPLRKSYFERGNDNEKLPQTEDEN